VDPLQIWISTARPSPVMVWTLAQAQTFLAAARRHRLYALYHLIARRGLTDYLIYEYPQVMSGGAAPEPRNYRTRNSSIYGTVSLYQTERNRYGHQC
jgi:hypothetical protein